MGRKEVLERKRKQAAKTCKSLETFVGKKRREEQGPSETEPAATTSSDGNQGEIADSSSSHQYDKTTETPSSSKQQMPANPSSNLMDGSINLGNIITATMSISEITKNIDNLTTREKYQLLTEHQTPPADHAFPKTFSHGYNRSFQHKWLRDYPWLVYSEKLDGAYCKYCSLFCPSEKRSLKQGLVNAPFTKWKKMSTYSLKHANSKQHADAIKSAETFISSVENPEQHIDVRINKQKETLIKENRHIVRCCAEAVLFCGKQCIALRGDTERLDQVGNPGNFLAFLKVMSAHDAALHDHLEKPRQKNATYLSPITQNTIIEIIGKHMILKSIIEEVKKAKFFSVMADEVTSSNKEYMPIVLRFVDHENNIREQFVHFSKLQRTTGSAIANVLLSVLRDELGLDLQMLRGQGYDGAANMSSNCKGVQAVISREAPQAVYNHCSAHVLNLVLVNSCKTVLVRNMTDQLQQVCLFFLYSPKRMGTLEDVVKHHVADTGRRKPLIDLCKTRWAERHNAYQHFYQCYVFIVKTFERIALGAHAGTYDTIFDDGWDPETRSKANSLLHAITAFGFIVSFLAVYQFLSHFSGIAVKLQGSTMDIISAFNQIQDIKDVYAHIQANTEVEFHKVYQHAERMAAAVDVQPSMPRVCHRQVNRPNATTNDMGPEQYYRINVAVPLLAHIVDGLDTRFSAIAKKASTLLGLVPSILCKEHIDVTDARELYKDDLPSSELLEAELTHWKIKFLKVPESERPDTLAKAIKACDKDIFPNLHILLKIACTLTVTTSECERNASALRRLNTFMRAGMTEERLTSLALIHIHYNYKVDTEKVVDIFAKQHPRRLALESVLLQNSA